MTLREQTEKQNHLQELHESELTVLIANTSSFWHQSQNYSLLLTLTWQMPLFLLLFNCRLLCAFLYMIINIFFCVTVQWQSLYLEWFTFLPLLFSVWNKDLKLFLEVKWIFCTSCDQLLQGMIKFYSVHFHLPFAIFVTVHLPLFCLLPLMYW